MTQLLKEYYQMREYYRKLADESGEYDEKRNEEFNQKCHEFYSRMNENEILYLQSKSQGMSKAAYEPYLKKLKAKKVSIKSQKETVATTLAHAQ